MTYSAVFYRQRRQSVRTSARLVLPLILDLLRPQSLVDVGCGTGAWLAMASELGVPETLGMDGPWVSRSALEIPVRRFRETDFTQAHWVPNRRFDLAMSLEVAEHLPPDCAGSFIEGLCTLAPVVLFSAAVPRQGGLFHVNEQWPAYWIDRFAKQGYELVDVIRGRIWREKRIPVWYRQNILLFVRAGRTELIQRLRAEHGAYDLRGLDLVHPDHYGRVVQFPGAWELLKAFPLALIRSAVAAPTNLRSLLANRQRGTQKPHRGVPKQTASAKL